MYVCIYAHPVTCACSRCARLQVPRRGASLLVYGVRHKPVSLIHIYIRIVIDRLDNHAAAVASTTTVWCYKCLAAARRSL
jgi:hypothetical protein